MIYGAESMYCTYITLMISKTKATTHSSYNNKNSNSNSNNDNNIGTEI